MAQLPFVGTPVVGPDDLPFIGMPDFLENKGNKGEPNGYAPLDANSKVPTANLPDQASLDAEVDGKITTHNSATTSVHGIANTANLVLTSDSRLADSRQPTTHTHNNADLPELGEVLGQQVDTLYATGPESNQNRFTASRNKRWIVEFGGSTGTINIYFPSSGVRAGDRLRFSFTTSAGLTARINLTPAGSVSVPPLTLYRWSGYSMITGAGMIWVSDQEWTATSTSDGSMSSSDKAKLDGVASGAEVNVNADWNAVSGDAQILNKPNSFTPSAHTHAPSEITGTAVITNDSRLSDSRVPTSHTHGNITNAGAIGSTANLPLITTTSGAITTGSFGTTANTFCEGNDSRISGIAGGSINTSGGGTINTSNGGGSILTSGMSSANYSSIGGKIDLRALLDETSNGGSIISTGNNGYNGGTLNMSAGGTNNGGSIDTRGGGEGVGGSINISNGGGSINTSLRGGSINTSLSGGSINLSDGGGSINTSGEGGSIDTRGTGSIQLGRIQTRTTLVGSATSSSDNPTITLPNQSGTIALTSDSRFTDSRTPTAHTHAISQVTNLQATLTAFAIALG